MKRFILFLIMFALSCAMLKQANDFYNQENYQAAIEECLREIEKDSLNVDAYLLLGKSYYALGKLNEASHSYEEVLKIKPATRIAQKAEAELIKIKLTIGNQAAKEKNFGRAFSEFKEILERDSTNFAAILGLAKAYAANGWLMKSKKYFLKASKFDSKSNFIKSELARIDSLTKLADRNFAKGKRYYLQGKNISASKYLKKALKFQADHREAKYYYHMAQGKILYRKGGKSRLWDAIEHFGKAMMIHENSAEPHFYMAKAYEKKNRNEFDNAISEYKIALKKEPNGKYAAKCKKKIHELSARRDKLKRFWGK